MVFYSINELTEKVNSLQAALIGLVVLTINPIITIDTNFYNQVINVIMDSIKVLCQLSISGLTIYLMIIKIKNEKNGNRNKKQND
jgi:hypothetical protein